jgi:hypothetical protein
MTDELETLHADLLAAYRIIEEYRGDLPAGTSVDTAFSVGEAMATLGKAKALVGRDIDQLAAKATP